MTEDPTSLLARGRREIDGIDHKLVELLAQRFRITANIGQVKARLAMPARDPAREREKFVEVRRMAAALGLKESTVEAVFKTIIDEVVKDHEATRTSGGR